MKPVSDNLPADSRQRIIDAAAEVFMEEGYRASVERIAAKAGVARQTLYNHFPSKDDLFGEVVRGYMASVLVLLDGDDGDVRESLLRFGASFRGRLMGDGCLAAFRTVVAEVPRFPALAGAFFDNGPARTVHCLAEFLASAMERGTLRKDHPLFAAEMLLGMLGGVERTRRLCGHPALSPESEAQRVIDIVDCFLRAFAPER